MIDERSIETILEAFRVRVEKRVPISPTQWIESALQLNTFIGKEYEKLASLESELANAELIALENSKSAVEAKMKVRASDVWVAKRNQELRIKQIEEFIKLGKKYGQLASDEARHGL